MRGCFAIGEGRKHFELRRNSGCGKVPLAGDETIEARSLGRSHRPFASLAKKLPWFACAQSHDASHFFLTPCL